MDRDLTKRFSGLLQLAQVPIGLAFVDALPEGVTHIQRHVPSACTFWRLAEQGVFYATADDHQECPIGMMTMGFPLSASVQQLGQTLVGMMSNVEYFSPEEVNTLPVVEKAHQYIIYGRLDQLPIAADVVFCIVNTQQAMLVAEATGSSNWLQASGQLIFGRPTCAVIPHALRTGSPAMSFGCVGARTYIGLNASELVLTLPASEFANLVTRLETIVAANKALAPFYQEKKEKFSNQ